MPLLYTRVHNSYIIVSNYKQKHFGTKFCLSFPVYAFRIAGMGIMLRIIDVSSVTAHVPHVTVEKSTHVSAVKVTYY